MVYKGIAYEMGSNYQMIPVGRIDSAGRIAEVSPQKLCPDCLLEFSVTAISEAEIRAGEQFVFYCPRCGSGMDQPLGIGA